MNHHHRKVLQAIFAHPVSANIDFKDVLSVFGELGAEVDNKTGSRVGVTLNGHNAAFHNANHTMPKGEVMQVKKFLQDCGVNPDNYPA
ncbi:hypothetical protein NK718_07310 [Alsobacter sp. SYSU M60028]|uniref:Type II toxin-antitoxin system HicA family toxin n=1 Tax=Alsobacter ponti TaxID=2962936 RepID=A0ABT1LBJ7_9HYPH|nr:type II toxin-antitoxin system HicA family toxin [Alsobacter ponti]MCP8938318.1 hypothetical protein [Alsobacter ponti]